MIVGALAVACPSGQNDRSIETGRTPATTASCPSLEEAKYSGLFPSYSEKDIVDTYNERFEEISSNIHLEFQLKLYNSRGTDNRLRLINPNYNVAEIYERNSDTTFHDKPSITVFIMDNRAYIRYDIRGPNGIADGNPDRRGCYDWNNDLLDMLSENLAKFRLNERMAPRPSPSNIIQIS